MVKLFLASLKDISQRIVAYDVLQAYQREPAELVKFRDAGLDFASAEQGLDLLRGHASTYSDTNTFTFFATWLAKHVMEPNDSDDTSPDVYRGALRELISDMLELAVELNSPEAFLSVGHDVTRKVVEVLNDNGLLAHSDKEDIAEVVSNVLRWLPHIVHSWCFACL